MRSRWLLATVHPETALAGRSRLPSTITVGTAGLRTSRTMHRGRWVTLAKGLARPAPCLCLCLGESIVISLTLCNHGKALRSGDSYSNLVCCSLLPWTGIIDCGRSTHLHLSVPVGHDVSSSKDKCSRSRLGEEEKTKSLPTLIPGQPATATKSLTYPLAARLGFHLLMGFRCFCVWQIQAGSSQVV